MHRLTLLTTVAHVRGFDTGTMVTTPQAIQAAKAHNARGGSMDEMERFASDTGAMVDYWDLTDTLVDGIEAMRLAGEKYLPKFSDEETTEYAYRLKTTKMTNVYRDIVENLSSKPFEQEVIFVEDDNKPVPQEMIDFIEDVDGSGNNLTGFASATFFNGINSAIDWIFVDQDKANPTIRSRADEKAAGIRPYWSHVLGRNVREVRSKVINGKETFTYIRIYEPGKPDHVRVFERLDTGVVTWKLYEKTDRPHENGKTAYIIADEGTIAIGVIPLVPFHTGRRDGRTWRFFPVMRDAADLQVELYLQESGLKFAKQLTAYPMLAGNGVTPAKEPGGGIKRIAVGPSRVLYAPPNNAGHAGSWAYVEPNASSLKFLADDIKDTMKELREIGRQPLTAQSGNLTVITTAMAASKARTAVARWAFGLKDALENACVMTCLWMGIKTEQYDPTVFVFTEFDEFTDGKDLETLDADRDRGDISRETLLEEKKRRGVYGPEFSIDRENERLLKETPGDGADNDPDDVPPPTPEDKPQE